MSTSDRASNASQDLKGRAKETVGSATGNDDLKNKGRSDQAKASLKDAGESVKDAGNAVKDAVQK